MTATNHALAGALIGSFLPLPLAIPAAFVSHFVMDALPHFGVDEKERNKSSMYKTVVYSDSILAVLVGLILALSHKWSMLLCGFVAFSPDVTLIYYYLKHNRDFNISTINSGRFFKLHLNIQMERPWGIASELIVMALLFVVLLKRI